jgi:hypothetical protein
MLRIETEQHGDVFRISLYGRMAGDWVILLDRYWRSIIESVPAARVTAVLSDVSFIDAEGEKLLERMVQHGVELVASGCVNRYVVDTIRKRSMPRTDEKTGSHR